MKKFTKICLITAAVMILVGGSVCVAGAAGGGFRTLNREWRERGHEVHANFWSRVADSLAYGGSRGFEEGWYDDWKEEWYEATGQLQADWDDTVDDTLDDVMDEVKRGVRQGVVDGVEYGLDYGDGTYDDDYYDDGYYDDYGHDDDYDDDYDDHEDRWDSEHRSVKNRVTVSTQNYVDTGVKAADIKNMKVSVGGASFYVQPVSGDTFGLEKKRGNDSYSYFTEGNTLYVEKRGYTDSLDEYKNEDLCLYIPEGAVLGELFLAVGGGAADMGDLTADEIEIQVGGGTFLAEMVKARELNVDVGTGDITLNRMEVQELDLDTGMGKALLNGTVSHKVDIDCAMGEVELNLTGAEKDYNYELETSAGTIDVGGESYTAIADEKYINNKATAKCSLQCAMGSIRVTFGN